MLDDERSVPGSGELPRARPAHDAERGETVQSALDGEEALHREAPGCAPRVGADPEPRLQQVALAERGDAERKDSFKPREVEISPSKDRGRMLDCDVEPVLQYEIERDRLASDAEVKAQVAEPPRCGGGVRPVGARSVEQAEVRPLGEGSLILERKRESGMES